MEEVPIDQDMKRPTTLPPDEVNTSSSATAVATAAPSSSSDQGSPPSGGPQPLDTGDAGVSTANGGDGGATPAAAAFAHHPGGLTEKECTDMVMRFAKLTTRETKVPMPRAADVPKHPVYGPMLVDCGNSATKKQHRCTMAAHTTHAWKKCMQ